VQALLIGLAVSGLGLSLTAHWADRRRLRRASADQVGFMPWPTIAMIGIALAVGSAALAALSR
jgi:hypothetical protein